jgi:hypothetical protein
VFNDPDALCPSTEMLTKHDTAEMWQFFIEFIGKREDNFEFWYNLAKTYYLSVLYSEECIARYRKQRGSRLWSHSKFVPLQRNQAT